ncbi:MAG TPA: hypothetical protein VHM47_03155 [Actinomycetota bacterium]|nr:hypothetical protein [Actinomycetota bacterium]
MLATFSAVEGAINVGGNVERLVDLGLEITAWEGPPTPEMQTGTETIGSHLELHGKLDLIVLVLAVTCMATARYW